MSRQQYGAVREYRDNPDLIYRDDPDTNNSANCQKLVCTEYVCDVIISSTGAGFTAAVNEISCNIQLIANSASTLERQVNDVGTARDSAALRQKIHDTEQKTNRLIATTTQKFKNLARQKSPNTQSKLQIERLKSDFEDTIQRYNRLQKSVANKVKSAPPIQTRTKQDTLIDLTGDDMLMLQRSEQSGLDDQRRVQLQAQSDVVDADLQMIEEREEQIRQLEGDIINVNEIFRDLAALVYEQGDMVDSIEANVERGYENVERGNQQLQQASKYATKYRKKLCILGIVMAVVTAVVIIILVVELRKK